MSTGTRSGKTSLLAYLAEMILFNLRWLVRAKSGGDTKFKSEIMLAFMLRGLEDFWNKAAVSPFFRPKASGGAFFCPKDRSSLIMDF